ncbi:hypothetical protein GGS20DRAFT_174842 [Poronia punctata]|nr:hypothetical protein GGS20DRAFT_174842 [Poronia punctata]
MAPTGGGNPVIGAGRGRGQSSSQDPGLCQISLINSATPGSQVAASNSTVKAWVGRRQPSWLANATAVQPSPRPDLLRPPAAALLAASVPIARTPPAQVQDQVSERQQLPLTPPRTSLFSAAPPLTLADAVSPSPAETDEPSLPLSIRAGTSTTRDPRAVHQGATTRSENANFVYDGNANINNPMPPKSQVPVTVSLDGAGTSRSSPGQTQPAISPAALSPIMARDTNQCSTPAGLSNTGTVPRDSPQRPPQQWFQSIVSKRRLAVNQSFDVFDPRGARGELGLYLQQVGGERGLEETTERPRFTLLKHACRDGDFFFLVLHQFFCAWTVNQASVHRLCDEGSFDVSLIDDGFLILGTILKGNSKLSERFLSWFAQFPVAHLGSLQANAFQQRTSRQVLDFLARLSQHWIAVSQAHTRSGYPLLVSELFSTFRLFSSVLQRLAFRTSRKSLGVADFPLGKLFDDLFQADQDKHWNPANGTFSRPFEGKEYDDYNNALAHHYKSLIVRVRYPASAMPSSHNSPAISHVLPMMHASVPVFPDLPSDHLHAKRAHNFGPISTPIVSTRAGPAMQTARSASSTNSLTSALQHISVSTLPASPAFTPRHSSTASPALQRGSSSTTGQVTSPYPPPMHVSQSHLGPSNPQPPPDTQHRLSFLQPREPSQPQRLQQHPAHQQHFPQHHRPPSPMPLAQIAHGNVTGPVAAVDPQALQPQTIHSILPQPYSTPQYLPIFQIGSAPLRTVMSLNGLPSNMAGLGGLVDLPPSPESTNPARPRHVSPPNIPSSQSETSTTTTRDRLIPAPGVRLNRQEHPGTPYERYSAAASLHQAHLRSPKRIFRGFATTSAPERHYQAIKGFALHPTPIPPQPFLYCFTFDLDDAVFAQLSFDEKIFGESEPTNRFQHGSLRLRARCCFHTTTAYGVPESVWVTLETAWPDHIFVTMNNKVMTIKRKQHHSKDLPVEVTSFLQPGTNTLSVSIPTQHIPTRQRTPHIAVEIVEVLGHSAILQMVRESGHIPARETREVIRSRLAGGALGLFGDENEVEMPIDGISIDLADPFSATIFNVPVRGARCSHLDCFDLENWLNSRPRKRSTCICGRNRNLGCVCPMEPSLVDKWKCPICDGDARPYSLRVDDLLVEIRVHLEKNDQLKTKAITVYASGSWKANVLADDDDSETNSEGHDPPIIRSSRITTQLETIEVIDLEE